MVNYFRICLIKAISCADLLISIVLSFITQRNKIPSTSMLHGLCQVFPSWYWPQRYINAVCHHVYCIEVCNVIGVCLATNLPICSLLFGLSWIVLEFKVHFKLAQMRPNYHFWLPWQRIQHFWKARPQLLCVVNSNFFSILYHFQVIPGFPYNGISYVGASEWRFSAPSSPKMENFLWDPQKAHTCIKRRWSTPHNALVWSVVLTVGRGEWMKKGNPEKFAFANV